MGNGDVGVIYLLYEPTKKINLRFYSNKSNVNVTYQQTVVYIKYVFCQFFCQYVNVLLEVIKVTNIH